MTGRTEWSKSLPQNIEERENKWRLLKRPLGQHSTHQHSHYRGPRRRREKGPEKIFEEIIAENFPNMGKEIVNQVQETQTVPGRINPWRNTPRHTVIKLTKIKDGDKTLKVSREKWQITYKGIPIRHLNRNSTRQGNGMIYLKPRKGRICNQQYSTQQDSPSDLMEKPDLSRQTKVKRIQHHQTSFTTNAKGTSLEKKHKRRKRPTENKVKINKKMVKGSYVSITNLNINGLNTPIKQDRLAG